MDRRNIVVFVSSTQQGLRLDQVLGATDLLSRTRARKLIAQGAVWVDGRRTKVAGRKMQSGQRIEVFLGGREEDVSAERRDLPVLFRDERFVVIDKPCGLPSAPTPSKSQGVVTSILVDQLGLQREPFPVHRLDRDTSGIMVLALDRQGAALATRLQERGLITRKYLALAVGRPESDDGTWDAALGRDPRRQGRWRVTAAGRRAETKYRVLGPSRFSGIWLLELELVTGRTHQIRIHMAHAGCPVLGDPWYGTGRDLPDGCDGAWVRCLGGRPRMFLHSAFWETKDQALSLSVSSVPDWKGEIEAHWTEQTGLWR